MPTPSMLFETARKAKTRLTDMLVQEVSLVDRGANQKRWVVMKRDENMTTPATPTQKMTLKLPTAAKEGLSDGLAQALDQATALVTMISESEADDSAAVPMELGTALKQIGELFAALASQYAPEQTAPRADAAPPAAPPPPDQAKAADAGGVAKSLPAPHLDPAYATPLREDDIGTALRKTIAAAHVEIAVVEKAGRKIAGARHAKLTSLHAELGKLLNELAFDDASAAATATTPATKTALEKKLDEANAARAALEKRATDAETKLQDRVVKSDPIGNGSSGGEKPPSTGGGEVTWSHDLAAEVVANRNKRKLSAVR